MQRYLIKDQLYLITDNSKVKGQEINQLPFNIYKDSIKLAVVYVRWSGADQSLKHSLDIQLNAVMIKARTLGYDVLVLFIDVETSAYHNEAIKRKEMVKLKEFVLRNSNVDALIFWKDSRVSRQIYDFPLQILMPIKSLRPELKVYSTDLEGEWDLNNPLVQLHATMNHQDSEQKSSISKEYQIGKLKSGERPEGRPPYGYDFNKEDGVYSRNEYSYIVIFIFYLYYHGYSEETICEILERSGITTPDE
ncbi:recombinase family protein [Bacillus sp. JJ1533]|uniref:recombinase family protein n=1 Tax=Bacillus sp. JJ1533 TaxID=3122959 RepID=UPI002FFE9735